MVAGFNVNSEETLQLVVDYAQKKTHQQQMVSHVKLRLSRGALKAFNKFDVEVSLISHNKLVNSRNTLRCYVLLNSVAACLTLL